MLQREEVPVKHRLLTGVLRLPQHSFGQWCALCTSARLGGAHGQGCRGAPAKRGWVEPPAGTSCVYQCHERMGAPAGARRRRRPAAHDDTIVSGRHAAFHAFPLAGLTLGGGRVGPPAAPPAAEKLG